MKQRELMVKEVLDGHPELRHYSYSNVILPCSPNIRYPDFVFVLQDRVVILEVDEDAHRYYSRDCEVSRVTELMENIGGRPLYLIRFNPLKSLLPVLVAQILSFFKVTHNDMMLNTSFIGYGDLEYDIAHEIEELSIKRRMVA